MVWNKARNYLDLMINATSVLNLVSAVASTSSEDTETIKAQQVQGFSACPMTIKKNKLRRPAPQENTQTLSFDL